MPKITVIGLNVIGEPVSAYQRELVQEAAVLVGGKRHLALFSTTTAAHQLSITGSINRLLTALERFYEQQQRIVVLATGDPLLYGIGQTLLKRFGRDAIRVIPGISSVQAALSRLGLSSANSLVLSKHTQDSEDDLRRLRYFPQGVILTAGKQGAVEVLREIIHLIPAAAAWQGAVCQALGSPEEQIVEGRLTELLDHQYLATNLVVVKNPEPEIIPCPNVTFGRPDHDFTHTKNLITHPEVRAVSLAKLELQQAKVLWDLGAGSGSVGIEAALLKPALSVISVEKQPDRVLQIQENIAQYGLQNVQVQEGTAANLLTELPQPDRVFLGGGGRELASLLTASYLRVPEGGLLVVNTVTLDSLQVVWNFLQQQHLQAEIVTVQISRAKPLAGYQLLQGENPVTVFQVRKTC